MSKAAPAPSALGRFWYRWRFHLNVLLVLIPLGFMPKYFQDVALFRGDSGLGEREFGEMVAGNELHITTLDAGHHRLPVVTVKTQACADSDGLHDDWMNGEATA